MTWTEASTGWARRRDQLSFAMMMLAAVTGAALPSLRGAEPEPPRRLSIGKKSDSSAGNRLSVKGGSERRWYLGPANPTTDIDSAWRYGPYIVVFGWAGLAGLNTVIDADSGAEVLEFLGYDPKITAKGLIVFRRFYPHFSDPAIVSDRIAVLNLNEPMLHFVPVKGQLPTDAAGVDIYPPAATPGERHLIGGNYFTGEDGTALFLVDQTTTNKLCIVRLPLERTAADSGREYCPTPRELGGTDPGAVHVSKFRQQGGGELILSLDLPGAEPGSPPRTFRIDRESLAIARVQSSAEMPESTLQVPWAVQQKCALRLVVPDLASADTQAHVMDAATAEVTIDVYGRVKDVSLSGSVPEVRDRLRRAILEWKFKPTVLDEHPVEVLTQITAPAGRFGRVSEQTP